MEFSILGGGRWGVALGIHLARRGHSVLIYDINSEAVNKIKKGKHPYIQNFTLPKSIYATENLKDVEGFENIVCALPTQAVREVFSKLKLGKSKVISASKGIEIKTLKRVTQIIRETQQEVDLFALSGPSFAEEVSKGLPTAVVLAYEKNKTVAEILRREITSEEFRVYINADITGVELGGAMKNVIALACGISDGLGFGHNARAALITRGLMEMTRIGVKLGAKRETFFGLSGAGDLILTATSDLSRNRTFGLLLGKGYKPAQALKKIGQVVEGVKTAEALYFLTKKEKIYAPITSAVYKVVVKGEDLKKIIREMLLRFPGEEFS